MSSPMNPLMKSYYDKQYSYSDEEFGLFFQRVKASSSGDKSTAKPKTWLWKMKKTVINDCNKYYFNLPNYSQSLDLLIKLVVSNGIMLVEDDGQVSRGAENADFQRFLKSFPEGDVSFLWEALRLYRTKGNLMANLVEKDAATEEDAKNIWDLYAPDRFGIETTAQNPTTAKNTVVAYYYLPHTGQPILIDKPENTIALKSNPSGVFGVPPILFNANLSSAIVADVRKFGQAKNLGAFKKQVISPLKVEIKNNGEKTYRKLSNDELADIRGDINKSMNDASQSVQVTDVEFTSSEIAPVLPDSDFIKLYGETYAMHVSKLTGLAPYMVMAKEPNRSVTEQQYKEMIQMQVQPLNSLFTKFVKKMYEIWAKANQVTADLNLTLINPKAFLDAQIDGVTLIKALNLNAISLDEFRNFLGLEPANEDLATAFEVKNQAPISKNI